MRRDASGGFWGFFWQAQRCDKKITLTYNDRGDGWVLVDSTAFKAAVRRAERLGCVRFAHISAISPTTTTVIPLKRSGKLIWTLGCNFICFALTLKDI